MYFFRLEGSYKALQFDVDVEFDTLRTPLAFDSQSGQQIDRLATSFNMIVAVGKEKQHGRGCASIISCLLTP